MFADAEALAALALANVPAADLGAGRALVAATETAFRKQAKAHGARVAATARKREAARALRDWMVPFRAMVTIACEARPQLIEALGWRARS